MSAPKPLASLTPKLLARKGGARPAMRPAFQQPQPAAGHLLDLDLELDLGFNDMGEGESGPTHEAEIVAIHGAAMSAPVGVPEVVRQQESILARVAEAPAATAPARRRRSALADGRNAAFTLRLDAERHLKLRLACTLDNRSAQQIVTEALDRLIAELPEVAALAAEAAKRR